MRIKFLFVEVFFNIQVFWFIRYGGTLWTNIVNREGIFIFIDSKFARQKAKAVIRIFSLKVAVERIFGLELSVFLFEKSLPTLLNFSKDLLKMKPICLKQFLWIVDFIRYFLRQVEENYWRHMLL